MDYGNIYTPEERPERAMYLLEVVGMADQAHKLPPTLSGGQQQSIAVARALANDPADRPSSCRALVRSLADCGSEPRREDTVELDISRLQAHGAHRIAEQRRAEPQPGLGIHGVEDVTPEIVAKVQSVMYEPQG